MSAWLNNVFNVGAGAIQTSAAAVAITSKNITGANDPNHTRQVFTLDALELRDGLPGGVNIETVTRAFDRVAYTNVIREKARQGSAQGRSDVLQEAERIATPLGAETLGDTVDRFFTSIHKLALKADDPTARSGVLAAGEDVSRRFNEIADGIETSRRDTLVEMQDVAEGLTETLAKIAEFNELIGQLRGQTGNPVRADLLDARDALVRKVASEIDINVIYNEKEGVTLLSSGSTLVEHGEFASVVVGTDAANNAQVQLIRGSKVNDITANLDGGRLGGLLEARDTDLVALRSELDGFAQDFASAVNAVHTAGDDLVGNAGLLLFTDASGGALGANAAASIQINPNILGAATPTDLIAARAAGEGVGGNSVALALALLGEGTDATLGVPSERWGLYTGRLGNALQNANNELALRDRTVLHAENLRDSASGVSLDDEMVNLTKYQRGFEAAMRVLQAADEMLSELVREIG